MGRAALRRSGILRTTERTRTRIEVVVVHSNSVIILVVLIDCSVGVDIDGGTEALAAVIARRSTDGSAAVRSVGEVLWAMGAMRAARSTAACTTVLGSETLLE